MGWYLTIGASTYCAPAVTAPTAPASVPAEADRFRIEPMPDSPPMTLICVEVAASTSVTSMNSGVSALLARTILSSVCCSAVDWITSL